jgi:hypothetical protein
MSANGDKPAKGKRTKAHRAKLVPLFMLGTDGEVYACCPTKMPPTRFIRDPQMILAIRLTQRERDIALDALQVGVKEAARTLAGILKSDA